MTPDLDLAPLTARQGPADRLRAASASTTWVWSMTLGAVTVAVAAVALGAMAVTGLEADPGAVVCLVMLLAAGLVVFGVVLHQTGGDSAIRAVARANDLELTQGSTAEHYAGGRFATGALLVHRSVPTRGKGFLEVGDTLPVGVQVTGGEDRQARVFLRVGLAGPVGPGSTDAGSTDGGELGGEVVDDELAAALTQWAGPHTVEWADHELTLHGRESLRPTRPDRVREGFELAERLRGRADDLLVVSTPGEPEPLSTSSGIPVPGLPRREAPTGRRRRPLVVVASLLAFLVVTPVVGTLVITLVADDLRGRSGLAAAVVGLLVAVMVAVGGGLFRFVSSPARRDTRDDAASEPS